MRWGVTVAVNNREVRVPKRSPIPTRDGRTRFWFGKIENHKARANYGTRAARVPCVSSRALRGTTQGPMGLDDKTCSVVQPGDGFGGAPHAFGPGRTCGFYFRSREAFSLLGPQRGFHPLPSSPLSFATRRTPRRRPSWRPVVRTATRAPKSREWNCFASWKCRICTKRIRQCRKFKPPMKSHRCAV